MPVGHGTALGSSLNEGRSINPGDTGGFRGRQPFFDRSLNEGRSINPGDTGHQAVGRGGDRARSTKAGA